MTGCTETLSEAVPTEPVSETEDIKNNYCYLGPKRKHEGEGFLRDTRTRVGKSSFADTDEEVSSSYPSSAFSNAVSSHFNFRASVVGFYPSRLVLLRNPSVQLIPEPIDLKRIAPETASGEDEKLPLLSQARREELISYFVNCAIEMTCQEREPEYITGLWLSDFLCFIDTWNPETKVRSTVKSRMLLCFNWMYDLMSLDARNRIVNQPRGTSSRNVQLSALYTKLGVFSLQWTFGQDKKKYSTDFYLVRDLDFDFIIGWPSMRRLELYRGNPLIAWRLSPTRQPSVN
ncbi:uncharacterized protein BO97DRAFT_462142 [Aspergillus homomorphus CBS 101889]|uniref:Uncharacterized protein n=1 Tax=Aspergillus homomorphus (strain CBS 101889) TaxID=1450537 RepID=A0A395HKD3_ASPHC|nr:hypothetical protein BO97DRAFT_462142 [Aspergillus homomorphus CBS 101889]RAL07969.1 hypothetical protein BO97DRAFT_462142 [Aspergillus homomorphus CBS 101889]